MLDIIWDKFDRELKQTVCKNLSSMLDIIWDKFDRKMIQTVCKVYAWAIIVTLGLGRPRKIPTLSNFEKNSPESSVRV